jgi:hypothetical protein
VRILRGGNLGYAKWEIHPGTFREIHKLLFEQLSNGASEQEVYSSLCLPVLRDILIFRQDNRIVRFAKLCFSCDQSIIVGTARKTFLFGQSI